MAIINHVLKNNNEKITSKYGNRTFMMRGKEVSDFHRGIDLIDKNNKSDYIIAYESGIVIDARDGIEGYDTVKSSGNYVYIKHNDTYTTKYQHMKLGSVKVKKGDTINKGDIIGYTGATGYATGIHLHFEIRKNNVQEDPLPYLEGTKTITKEKTYISTPVARNNTKDQIEVTIDNLRIRDNPNGNILGYAKKGIYNIISKETKDNYTWYQIETNKYIAYSPTWAILYEKDNTTKALEDLTNQIKIQGEKINSLTKENEELKQTISNYEEKINNLTNKLENTNNSLIYTVTKNDIYAIKLFKGETLYIKK